MAHKQFGLDDQTQVTIYKRRSNRNLRLTVTPRGEVRLSIPSWSSYGVGLRFARSRLGWIKQQRRPVPQLKNGQAIGKAHHLRFVRTTASKTTSRLHPTEVVVTHPVDLDASDPVVQTSAEAASIRALRHQAEKLLPQRLASLAAEHDFEYAKVSIKQLKSRWGSCDHESNIALNLFLMQLPWECIDYVLLHELTHTRILRHGPDFWNAMSAVLPDVAKRRKAIRQYQPVLYDSQAV